MTRVAQVAAVRLIAMARFGAVGISGLVVNQVALVVLTELVGLHYLLAAVAATQTSTAWNFVGIEYWAFSTRSLGRAGRFGRYGWFFTMNNLALIARIPLLWALVSAVALHYVVANVATLVLLFIVRFVVADGWIWRAMAVVPSPRPDATRTASHEDVGRYRYDLAGLVAIDSDVELPELAYFRTPDPVDPDIRIRVATVGRWPSRRSRFDRHADDLTYVEQLGAIGANFSITTGRPTEIRVSPLLAKSRHVLYTNVLEALLRFQLVSRGYVLAHSAAVIVDGRAVLLSAETDTGKTSTVITLVRRYAYEFLSDDMTIIASDGRAICYPKPMTLSYHTVAVISGRMLRRRQRAALSIQSRLHSRSGRAVGRFLGTLQIPIMSVNSLVQILVPPPKYPIDAIVPSRIGKEATISHAILMERGEPLRVRLSTSRATDRLIENTDDAYGFPPFGTFAPALVIEGMDYHALRAREREILERALSGVEAWRVRVTGHDWDSALQDILSGSHRELTPLPVMPPPRRAVAVTVPHSAGAHEFRAHPDADS